MARPKINIDWKEVEKLCAIACTGEEIAAFIGVSYDTLERAIKRKFKSSFADYYDQKAAIGSVSLRRKQFLMAQNGDRTMLIWLGKQRLGQTEKLTSINKNEHSGQIAIIDKEELRKVNAELEEEC